MAVPIVSWYNQANTTQETKWEIGTIDAGSVSTAKTFLIWNNRGGATNVSDMTSCVLTTKDASGGDTGELVTNKWIQAKCDSMNETTFTPIGGTTTKTIRSSTSPAGTIAGGANDGTTANSAANYSQITVQAQPSVTATAGSIDFLLRVLYTFS